MDECCVLRLMFRDPLCDAADHIPVLNIQIAVVIPGQAVGGGEDACFPFGNGHFIFTAVAFVGNRTEHAGELVVFIQQRDATF